MKTKTYLLATSKPWHKFQADDCLDVEASFLWAHDPSQLNEQISREKNIRYIFFLHWNWLVPENLWQNYECVCFHMTDVPYGRGGSPLQNLIVRGQENTKLTALRMIKEMDAGPVYTKRDLGLAGTAAEIYRRAGKLSFDIIHWMIENEPEPKPQKGMPTVFQRRKPKQSFLPKSGNMKELYDHIRMLDAPTYPPAFIEHGEFVIEFSDAKIQSDGLTAVASIRKK